jgi:PrcB C-terminal
MSYGTRLSIQKRFHNLLGLFLLLVEIAVPAPGRPGHQQVGDGAGTRNSSLTAETRSQKLEITQLSAANHSTIPESFVFVARDIDTYAVLRQAVTTLPDQNEEFFHSNVIVAVFLGQRRTGGFGIDITADENGGLRIVERKPPKGAMVKMVLSTPYRVVAVSAGQDAPLSLSLDETWRNRLRTYRLVDGELMISGGIAGKKQTFKLQGRVDVMRVAELCTFFFEVQTLESRSNRKLSDVASGKVEPAEKLDLTRVSALELTGAIRSPFRITARFAKEDQELSLHLQTVPATGVSDNFTATAFMKLIAISPQPKDTAVTI